MDTVCDELVEAAMALTDFEILPGVPAESPQLGPVWSDVEVEELSEFCGKVPPDLVVLLTRVGCIDAIEVGGGFASMTLEQIQQELTLDYGDALRALDWEGAQKRVVPLGTNSGGSYFLLDCDDEGVWKYNIHMRPVAKPTLVANSAADFFMKLADEWKAMATGQGGPYMTD